MSKEKPLNIYQRINAVMKTVDYIEKCERKVNGQYRFVSHDQVTGILHKPLAENGIVMVPSVESYKIDGNRTEVTVSVKFVNIDEPSDFIEVKHIGYGIDNGDKGPGKAISYATKYAMLKIFCLETGDDPDQNANVVHEPAIAYISPSQVKELEALFDNCTEDKQIEIRTTLKDKFKSPSFAKLPAEVYERLKKHLIQSQKKEEVLNEQVG